MKKNLSRLNKDGLMIYITPTSWLTGQYEYIQLCN